MLLLIVFKKTRDFALNLDVITRYILKAKNMPKMRDQKKPHKSFKINVLLVFIVEFLEAERSVEGKKFTQSSIYCWLLLFSKN